jgi:hypothetical protein
MEPAALNQQSIAFDFGNQKIMLDQQELTFANGAYKSSDEHHTARITHSSVNKSGKNGAAILVDNPGGSGTFFYVVGASNKDGNEIYSKPVLLGDRVSIVSVNVEDADTYNNGMITVTYLDRSTDASEASAAKKETTKQYAFQEDGNVIEVLQ